MGRAIRAAFTATRIGARKRLRAQSRLHDGKGRCGTSRGLIRKTTWCKAIPKASTAAKLDHAQIFFGADQKVFASVWWKQRRL